MIKSKKIQNAGFAVVQLFSLILIQFFLYRYMIEHIGMEQVGLWSLIISTTSVANVANLGMSSGVIRFVASASESEDKKEVGRIIMSSFVFNSISTGLLLLGFYLASDWILKQVLPDQKYFDLALMLFPISLFNFALSSTATLFWSIAEGYQNYKQKTIFSIIGQVLWFVGCVSLVPVLGLKGALYSQIFQSGLLLFSGAVFVYYRADIELRNYSFSTNTFKRLFNFGLSYQLTGWFTILIDPATKFFISKYGGLGLTAYFEMANRLTSQVRTILVSAVQTTVPFFASIEQKPKSEIKNQYEKIFYAVLYISVPSITVLLVFLPSICHVWLGKSSPEFIIFAAFLSIGWLVNLLSTPAYFANLGVGQLRPNIIQSIIQGLLNVLIMAAGVIVFDASNILYVSYSFSLVLGGLYLIRDFNTRFSVFTLNVIYYKRLFNFITAIVVALVVTLYLAKNPMSIHCTIIFNLSCSLLVLLWFIDQIKFVFFEIRRSLNSFV